MAEKFIVIWTIDGETMSVRIQLRMGHCSRPKSFCASMGAIWRSPYI
jgi:hypothetical protein